MRTAKHDHGFLFPVERSILLILAGDVTVNRPVWPHGAIEYYGNVSDVQRRGSDQVDEGELFHEVMQEFPGRRHGGVRDVEGGCGLSLRILCLRIQGEECKRREQIAAIQGAIPPR